MLVTEDYDLAADFHTRRSDFFIKSNALRRTYEMKYRGASGSINADPMAVALAADGTLGQKSEEGDAQERVGDAGPGNGDPERRAKVLLRIEIHQQHSQLALDLVSPHRRSIEARVEDRPR